MITTDAGIQFQQNQSTLPLAVLILDAVSNDIDDLRPLVPALLVALNALTRNAITHVR